MRQVRVWRAWLVVLMCLLVFGVVGAFGQHAAKGTNDDVGVSGQQVAKDPATGKFRPPTPEELKILAPLANNDSDAGLVVRSLPGGGKVVDLEGRFQNYSLAKKDAGGNISTGCVTNTKEAEDFLKSQPAKSKKEPATKTPAKAQSDPSTWEVM